MYASSEKIVVQESAQASVSLHVVYCCCLIPTRSLIK